MSGHHQLQLHLLNRWPTMGTAMLTPIFILLQKISQVLPGW